MAGKCKACHSEFRELIDERLLKGEAIDSISDYLKSKGVMISPPSIMRHKNNHIPEFMNGGKPLPECNITPEDTKLIDLDRIEKILNKEINSKDVFQSRFHERRKTQILLENILQTQLAIVSDLQNQYIEGKAGYPDPQIRNLKTIMDMVSELPTYKGKDFEIREGIKIITEESVKEKIEKSALKALRAIDKYQDWDYLKQRLKNPPVFPNSISKEESNFRIWVGKIREKYFHLADEIELEPLINDFMEGMYVDKNHKFYTEGYEYLLNLIMKKYPNPDLAHDRFELDEEYFIEALLEEFDYLNEDDESISEVIDRVNF